MSTWVNLAHHFGDPFVILRIGMYEVVNTDLAHGIVANKSDPAALEKLCTEYIVKHRPELEGLVLISMDFASRGSMNLLFVVVHPLLPKVQFGQSREEHLKPCATCRKSVLWNDKTYLDKCGEMCCSQDCADGVQPEYYTP